MRVALIFLFTAVNSLSVLLFAQGVTITGRIVDTETLEPLPYTHVFIDQTTIGAVSNENGEYIIEHVPNGDYKLVFSFVGYELYYKTISVADQDLRISARLIPLKELLESVEIKGSKDKEWEDQLTQFNKVFFGDKNLAKDCEVLNPWVLDFTYDKEDKVFKATASEPIQIRNKALGYSIECTLQNFSFDKKGYKIRGLYKFEEINTLDAKEAIKWTRNRRQAYQTSLRFLFKSILDRHTSENGFELYLDKRPTVSVANNYFHNEIDQRVFPFQADQHITPSGRPGFYKISIPNRLEIHHTTQFAQAKTYRDVVHPVSWIELEKEYVEVSQDGYIVNNHHIVTSGQLSGNRIAAMLPTNYSPGNVVVVNYLTKRMKAKRLQERAYLNTDKAFYYPGETVWFRAHMNYVNQSLKDSLSRVLYLDLIDQQKEVKLSKILKVDSLGAHGEIKLDGKLAPGTYYIRIYTSWMRNYGSDVIYHHPIVIMPGDKKIFQARIQEKNEDFIIELNRKNIFTSEIIELNLGLDSVRISDGVDCSIAVSPAEWSGYPKSPGIKETLSFPEDMPEGTLADFIYPLEYGFSISGLVSEPKKKTTVSSMAVIRGMMDSLYHFKTDNKGHFKIENLDFFDTVSFSFQARNKKGRIFGTTTVLPRDFPPIYLPKNELRITDLESKVLESPIQIISISASDTLVRQQKSNGSLLPAINLNAEYVIEEAELQRMNGGQNILDAIIGRVSGLQLDPSTGKLSIRNRFGTGGSGEPLIVVDGIPVNNPTELSTTVNLLQKQQQEQNPVVNNSSTNVTENTANQQESVANRTNQLITNQATTPVTNQTMTSSKELVGHIPVSDVYRVEVSTRGDSHYGSANGVIVIYTKKALGKNKEVKTFDLITIQGFTKPSTFKPLNDHLLLPPDFHPTAYWNPCVILSPKSKTTLSFTAPRKPGDYMIKVEGVSNSGVPLSGSILIHVTDEAATKLGQRQK
jgi:hypothetical protein